MGGTVPGLVVLGSTGKAEQAKGNKSVSSLAPRALHRLLPLGPALCEL